VVCSTRGVKLVAAELFASCCLIFMVLPCSAQSGVYNGQPNSPWSNCPLADFDSQIHFLNGPGDYYANVVDSRNISSHACIFDRPVVGSNCVSGLVRADQPESIDYECKFSTGHPFILYPGQIVRQGIRWRTTPSLFTELSFTPLSGSASCFQPMWGGGLGVSVIAPTLVKKECSNPEYSPYNFVISSDSSSGVGQATDTDQTPIFVVNSDRNQYEGGEYFSIHVSFVQPASEALIQHESCPTFYLRQRSPDGEIRIDEVHPMAFKGCSGFVPGYQPGDWQSGFELDSGANSRWSGFGEHTFQVLQLIGSLDDPKLHFATSNELRIQVDDPALIPRKWGPRARGVAVDITLDKDTFRVGEDVPIHLAIENFDAESPVYSPDPVWDPCNVVQIEVQDAQGRPLPYDSLFQDFSFCSGHGSELRPYEKGKIVPFERTLRGEGWLPNRVGTYTVAITWAPWDGPSKSAPLVDLPISRISATTEVTYAVARATAIIHIVGSNDANSK
jgi:hypothetical protein